MPDVRASRSTPLTQLSFGRIDKRFLTLAALVTHPNIEFKISM
jgi:hypothetical protein